MIKINKKVEYALMSLKHMAERPLDLVTAREICEHYSIPFDTTSKVLQQLHNHGIVHALKGVKGGYTLSKNLSEVSYLELCELIEGKSFEMKCSNKEASCELIKNCNIITPVKRFNYQVMNFFKELTLEELLQPNINIQSKTTQLETLT